MKYNLRKIGMLSLLCLLIGTISFAKTRREKKEEKNEKKYSLEQAMSDNAQLKTIAFSGVAFMTGTIGADSFMPPGKVADFFGFQYMRDIDENGHGHNTMFLTNVANNVLHILNEDQLNDMIELAKEQDKLYVEFAYGRFPLIKAFRDNLEGNTPNGATGLDLEAVKAYTAKLYEFDAQLSYNRAKILGGVIDSFTSEQKSYLAEMDFNNSATWPEIDENEELKRQLSHVQHVALMTYASELFSWYKGSVYADVYFCPERHGTYFGGFYMKDYPAMGNPDYFISTSLTGDSGEAFLNMLNNSQKKQITQIIDFQTESLSKIADIRKEISEKLRGFMKAKNVSEDEIFELVKEYGSLDGEMSYYYADGFAKVYKTLTNQQKSKLTEIRNQSILPDSNRAYLYANVIALPTEINSDYLFGIGDITDVSVTPSTEIIREEKGKKPPRRK